MNPCNAAVASLALLLLSTGCSRNPLPAKTETASVSLPADGNYAPAGTEIKVRTARAISSRAVAAGDRLEVQLAEPVEVNGQVKVPAGAIAVLSVVDAKPGIPLGTASGMVLKVTQLRRSIVDHVEVNTAGLQRE